MTLANALSGLRIANVWTALGGAPLRHGRGRAFWRGGCGYNVALDDAKGAWFDHAQGKGGGVLDLIQTALGVDRPGAVAWLSEAFALEIDSARKLTPAEKRTYQRARSQAEQFIEWRGAQLEAMRRQRDYHLHTYHEVLHAILLHGLDNSAAEWLADACEQQERLYQDLDSQIDGFIGASFDDLLPQFYQVRSAA